MKILIIILPALLSAVISNAFAFGQESKAAPESRIFDAAGGYSFNAPTGWTKKTSDGGYALVNPAQTIIVAVKAHNYKDFAGFVADSNLEEQGLKQIGETKNIGESTKYFRLAWQTNQGILVVDTLVLFSPYGGGVAVVSLTDDKNAATGLRAAAQVADTILFSRSQVSSAGSQWQTFLRGKQLIYLHTANGYGERRDIWLCPSGSFYMTFDGSSLSAIGSGVISSKNRGTWRVVSGNDPELLLEFQDGRISQYKLSHRAAGGILLNNTRYFVKPQSDCN